MEPTFNPHFITRVGIILQDDLQWNSHLTKLEKKLSCSISLLSKVKYDVSKPFKIYFPFNIASEIWGQNQTNCYFKKLLHLQKKHFE